MLDVSSALSQIRRPASRLLIRATETVLGAVLGGDVTIVHHPEEKAEADAEQPTRTFEEERATVAWLAAAFMLAEYVALAVTPTAHKHLEPGDLLKMGSRVKLLWGQLDAMAIAAERILFGTGWEAIGRSRGLSADVAEKRYEPVVQQIAAGEPTVYWSEGLRLPGVPSLALPVGAEALAALVERGRRRLR
ncbi:hypothetical protein GCM10022221_68500 [Actinocorallia aurea]